MPTRLSDLLTTTEVGEIFGFKAGHRMIVKLIHVGQLKAYLVKGRYLITPEAVEDYRRMRTGKIIQRVRNVTIREKRDAKRKERKERRERERKLITQAENTE